MKKILSCLTALFCGLLAVPSPAFAQGTAFTYQGQLNAGGSPAQGLYDLQFALYNANTGGNQIGVALTNSATAVNNGLFTVALNFGSVFNGSNYWLQIAARTNGAGGAFTALSPRQQITASPYALYAPNAGAAQTALNAGSVAAANVNGTLSLAQLPSAVITNNETNLNLSGTFTGSGKGLTNLSTTNLSGILPNAVLPVTVEANANLLYGVMQQSAGMPAMYQAAMYRLPPMGVGVWCDYSTSISEWLVTNMVTMMSTNGLRNAGYTILQLDDGWCRGHDTNGNVLVTLSNGTFYPQSPMMYVTNNWPHGMGYSANFCHTNGMKFGLYVGLGTNTCAGYAGSYGYYSNDFATFASWGVDYFKMEGCSGGGDPVAQAIEAADYGVGVTALPSGRWFAEQAGFASTQSEHPAFLNLSWWWNMQPWLAAEFNSYRGFGDAFGDGYGTDLCYQDELKKFDVLMRFSYMTGPGHFLDPDTIANDALSGNPAKFRSILSAYAMMSAPLMLMNPVSSPPALLYETNPGMIAIDQDPLVQPAFPAPSQGTNIYCGTNLWNLDGAFFWPVFTNCVYVKNLGEIFGTRKAVMMMNRSSNAISQTIYWTDLGFPATAVAQVWDVWNGTNVGNFQGSFTSATGPTDVGLFIVTYPVTTQVNSYASLANTASSTNYTIDASGPNRCALSASGDVCFNAVTNGPGEVDYLISNAASTTINILWPQACIGTPTGLGLSGTNWLFQLGSGQSIMLDFQAYSQNPPFSGVWFSLATATAGGASAASTLAAVASAATNVIDFAPNAPGFITLNLPLNSSNLIFAVANVVVTNQAQTRDIFIPAGFVPCNLNLPANWITESESGTNLAPTVIPAGYDLHIQLTVLGGVTTKYYAHYLLSHDPLNLDQDAASFLAAAGITGSTNITAINTLVLGLKNAGLWTNRWDALYPLMGGTASSCSWNLINTNKYKINWTAGASTFDVTGWHADGSASFGDTGFNPATAGNPAYTQNSATLFVYNETAAANPPFTGPADFMGATSPGGRAALVQNSATSLVDDGFNDGNGPATDCALAVTSFAGSLAVTRVNATTDNLYGNGQIGSNTANSSGMPNANIYLGCRNTSQSSAANFIAAKFGFAAIGGAISSSEFTTLSNLVYNFEASLGRQ